MSEGLCQCGCGRATTVRYGRACLFVSGHNKGRKGTGAGYTASCIRCGTVVPVKPHYEGKRKFCSTTCRDEYRREHNGPAHPSYKQVTVDCAICGTPFSIQPARLRAAQRYCKPACGNIARSRKLRAANLKPGCEKYGKACALERDGGACRMCGFADVVDVHHIVGKAKGGTHELSNLITLCPNHHALAHRKKLNAETLLAALPP